MTFPPFVPLLARWSLLVAFVLFGLIDLLWPVVRQLRTTGATGIAVHRAHPAERVVGVALAAGIAAASGWAVVLAACGPEGLGVRGAPAAVLAGNLLLVASIVVVAIAQAQMGRSWRVGIDAAPTALVTQGLFGRVRNPIYAGVMLALAGMVAVSPSAFTLLLLVQVALWIALQARLEEAHLARQHGEAYAVYAARAGRFLPGVGRLAPPR
jgi:protein-S-isoprenylcysteine O-methyltransferase Ste14